MVKNLFLIKIESFPSRKKSWNMCTAKNSCIYAPQARFEIVGLRRLSIEIQAVKKYFFFNFRKETSRGTLKRYVGAL